MMKLGRIGHIRTVALLGLVALATPTVATAQQESERVDRTVPIRANGQLRLKNFSGRVTITGTNRADIAMHAVRRATRDRLDHIKLDIRESDSSVTIEANRKDDSWPDRDNNVVDTEFDIEVPADIGVEVEVFSSNVDVKDVRGSERVHTFSGAIDVRDAWGSVDAETFSGNITVKLAASAGGRVDFDSFSGALQSDAALTYRSASRRRLSGEIGSGGNNDYHFKTFSGNVTIK
jgi:DUF4097 and DUF4098 domain-containing protein YvlB